MKQVKHHHRPEELNPTLDAAGDRLAAYLTNSIDDLDASTLQRLRAAREQAVEHRRLALVHAAQKELSVAGHGRSEQLSRPYGSQTLWQRLVGAGVVGALVLGLWLIDSVQSDISLREAAEIDRILLTDDLPPAAYVDPGFKYFLKLSYPDRAL